MKNWYDVFNNLATNYSNNLSTLSVPSSGSKISATNVNNLHSKIQEFRSDKFLGTQVSFWPTGTNVTVGSPIKPAQINSIITVVNNAGKIKCRNEATNSSSSQTNGSYSSGLNSYGTTGITCPNGLNGNGVQANFLNTVGCSSGYHQNGKDSNGWYDVTCQNGLHQNGVVANIYNTNYCQSGTKQNGKDNYLSCNNGYHSSYCYIGGQSHKCRNVQCTSGKNSSSCWSGKHTNGDQGGYSTGTCGHGTCGSGTDTNAKHSSTCTSGKKGNGSDGNGYSTGTCSCGTCNSGTDQNATCQHTTCSNVSKTHGLHGNTKTIDILCVHTNKTNG